MMISPNTIRIENFDYGSQKTEDRSIYNTERVIYAYTQGRWAAKKPGGSTPILSPTNISGRNFRIKLHLKWNLMKLF